MGSAHLQTVSDRARRLLAVLLLPLMFVPLGLWQAGRGASTVAAAVQDVADATQGAARLAELGARDPMMAVRLYRDDPVLYAAPLAARMLRDDAQGRLTRSLRVAQARVVLAWIVVAAGALAALAGGAGLLTARRAGRQALTSRDALVAAFGRVRALLPWLLGAQVAGLTLGTGAAALFEVGGAWFWEHGFRGELQLVALGLAIVGGVVAFGGAMLIGLRRSLAAFEPQPMRLVAREAGAHDAPGLWRMVEDLAAAQGTHVPDHVVTGLVEGFFVTASAVRLLPEDRLILGNTLHIPLPALALLDREEAGAVVAHELAHFAGEDPAYGQRFLPLYAGIGQSLQALVLTRERSGRAARGPALTLGLHLMAVFDGAVKHWSRVRELEADRAGIPAVGAQAAARALLRVDLAQALTRTVLDRVTDGAAPDDLVQAVRLRAADGLPALAAPEGEAPAWSTHPSTAQRLRALGVAPDAALLARAARPVHAAEPAEAAALFADFAALCAATSADLVAMVRSHRAAVRTHLETEAALPFEGARAVHDAPLLPALVAGASALVAGGLALLLLWLLATGHVQDRAESPDARLIVLATAAGLALGAAFGAWRSATLLRRARAPAIVLDAAGFRLPGLDRAVAWADLAGIGCTAERRFRVSFTLRPQAALPRRVGPGARVHPRGHRVVLGRLTPRGLTRQAFLDLLGRTWNAAAARAALADMDVSAGTAPSGTAGAATASSPAGP